MNLEPPNGSSDNLPRIEEDWTLRDALSEIIGAGADKGLVVGEESGGSSRGLLTLDSIRRVSHGSQDDAHDKRSSTTNGDERG